MFRRILRLALLAALLPCASFAQGVRNAYFFLSYQQTSATMTFCRVTGQNQDPFGPPINAATPLTTSGSSTTVTDPNTLAVFANVNVNDIIVVPNPQGPAVGAPTIGVVTAKANSNSITIDRAQNWSNGGNGSFFSYYHTTCGTTVNDGWIDVAGLEYKTLVFSLDVINSASNGVDVRWQCRAGAFLSTPVQVFPSTGVQTYTAVGVDTGVTALASFEPWDACRLGTAVHTAGNYQVSGFLMGKPLPAK